MGILGQPIDRVDGRQKVTGKATYAAEFTVPGVLHAVLVESTVGAGQIISFDLTEAQAMPGVIRIITPQNAIRLAEQKGGAADRPCAAAAGHDGAVQRSARGCGGG